MNRIENVYIKNKCNSCIVHSFDSKLVTLNSSQYKYYCNNFLFALVIYFDVGPPPTRNRVPFDITGNFINGWTVEWIPYELGVYSIAINYGPSHVTGSPFKCKVFDLSKVIIIRDFDASNAPPTEVSPEEVVFYGKI